MSSNLLEVSLRTINDKVKFIASSRENPVLTVDYFPPVGGGEGYTSLELLLISFSSCLGTALLTILRNRMRKTVTALRVNAKGVQREEHPMSLSKIMLEIELESPDLERDDVDKALTVSEQRICPVWAMIKGNTEVSVNYKINQ